MPDIIPPPGSLVSTQDNATFISNPHEQGANETDWTSYTPSYKGRGVPFTIDNRTTNTELVVTEGILPITGEEVIIKDGLSTEIKRGQLGNVTTAVEIVENISSAVLIDGVFNTPNDTQETALAFNNDGTKLYVVGVSSGTVNQYSLSVPYDTSTATDDSAGIFVGNRDTFPTDVAFSNDGSKMYIAGSETGSVYQFTLTVPFDMAGGFLYDGRLIPSQGGQILGLTFNDVGTKLYLADVSTSTVFQYSLSTPFDVLTSTYDSKSYTFTSIANPDVRNIKFNNSGTKLYLYLENDDSIAQHTLTVPYELDSISYDNDLYNLSGVGSIISNPAGFAFNDTGTKFFAAGSNGIFQYSLSEEVTRADISALGLTSAPSVACRSKLPRMFTSYEQDPERCISQDINLPFVRSTTSNYVTEIGDKVANLVTGDTIIPYDGIIPGSISLASYDGISVNVQPDGINPRGIDFSSDGTKMIIVNINDNSICQYTLSTPYDLSTATIDAGVLDVTPQDNAVLNAVFSTDDTKVYVVGAASDTIYQYDLSAAADISTAVYSSKSFSTETQSSQPVSLAIDSSMSRVYVLDGGLSTIFEYSLLTPGDLSTATYSGNSIDVRSEMSNAIGITFNTTGTRMFVLNASTNTIHEYALLTPFNLSTAVSVGKTFDISRQETYSRGIALSNDGTKLFATGDLTDTVFQYSLATSVNGTILTPGAPVPLTSDPTISATGTDVVSLTYDDARYGIQGQDAEPVCLEFSSDGSKMFILGAASDTIYEYTLSTPFDLSTADYNRNRLTVRSQDVTPTGIAFNTDGTKLYMIGDNSNSVFQYTLSTGFDVSTASYDSVNLSIGSQEGTPRDLTFNNDGSKMYLIGNGSDNVYQYSLSTPFDLSTATYDGVSFSVNAQNAFPFAVVFNDTGSKMYVLGIQNTPTVFQYSLVTPFDLSTANSTPAGSFVVSNEDPNPTSIALSNDGTKFYMLSGNFNVPEDSVYQYTLSTAFSISSAVYDTVSLNVGGQDSPNAVAFDDTGNKMIVLGSTTDAIFEYNVASAFDLTSGVTYTGNNFVLTPYISGTTAAIVFNNNGTKLYVLTYSNLVYQFALSTPYDITTLGAPEGSFDISNEVFGATGIAFDDNGTNFYVTNTSRVYQYSLTTPYDLVGGLGVRPVSLDLTSEDTAAYDMAFNPDGTKLYTVGIAGDAVYQYSLSTPFDLSTATYDNISFSVSSEATVPTGLDFSNDGTKMYVFDANTDRVYQYSLSTAFDISTATYDTISLNVGAQDSNCNSVLFNDTGTKMYSSGRASDIVYQYSLSTPFDLSTATYDNISLNLGLSGETDPFGLTFNNNGTRLYVVGGDTVSVQQFSLTTPFDISSATYDNISYDVSGQVQQAINPQIPFAINFSNDGLRMFIQAGRRNTGYTVSIIYQYTLDSPYDITSAVYDSFTLNTQYTQRNVFIGNENNTMVDLKFSLDGSFMYALGNNIETGIYKYYMSQPYNINTLEFTGDFYTTRTEEQVASGFTFNNDQTKLFIVGQDSSYAYQYSVGFNDVYTLEFDALAYEPVLTAIPDRSVEHTTVVGEQWVDDYIQVNYARVNGDGRAIQYKFIADTQEAVIEARYDLTKIAPGIRDI